MDRMNYNRKVKELMVPVTSSIAKEIDKNPRKKKEKNKSFFGSRSFEGKPFKEELFKEEPFIPKRASYTPKSILRMRRNQSNKKKSSRNNDDTDDFHSMFDLGTDKNESDKASTSKTKPTQTIKVKSSRDKGGIQHFLKPELEGIEILSSDDSEEEVKRESGLYKPTRAHSSDENDKDEDEIDRKKSVRRRDRSRSKNQDSRKSGSGINANGKLTKIIYEHHDDPNDLCSRLRQLVSLKNAANINHRLEKNTIIVRLRELGCII